MSLRDHYKFDLSSSAWIAYERSLHEAMQCSAWFSGYSDMTDDGRRHLVGYWQPCRPDVSHGALCSSLGNLKLRRRNLRWAMSIKSDDANFLTITCIRICLKMNRRSSRQRRSVLRCRSELRRQILKQRWEGWNLTILHLSDILLRPGTAWNWTRTDRLDNEGIYLCRGQSYGDKFQGGGERIDSYYPAISLTHFCTQELPEIELVPIVSTTKESTSVEDRAMETSSKAAVRG